MSSSTPLNLGPLQFDIRAFWFRKIKTVEDVPEIQIEFEKIKDRYLDIAEFKYEESLEHDPIQAQRVFDLDVHTADVMHRDFYWLKETFGGTDLAGLSLAIAQELYPKKEWDIIEDDEESVVTDSERSIVFDMKYGDQLSAKASLLFVGDTFFSDDTKAVEEVLRFRQARLDRLNAILDKAQSTLSRFSQAGEVIDIKNPRDQDFP